MYSIDRANGIAEVSSEYDSGTLETYSRQQSIDSEFLDAVCNGIVVIGKDFKITSQNYISRARMGNLVGQLCYKTLENRSAPCENCPRTAKSNSEYEISMRCAGKKYSLYEVRIHQSEEDDRIVEVYPNMIDRDIMAKDLYNYREEINLINSLVDSISNATPDS